MTFSTDSNSTYQSRRSVVIAPTAAVASSQPLATEAGLSVLRAGGTAADAAVAVAAALQVTQACSTGLGGDAFCLFYDATTGAVRAYNGSGRSPAALTLDQARRVAVRTDSGEALPDFHAHTVTVPGAADAWFAVHGELGRLAMSRVLQPAVRLARDGFSLEPMTALWWGAGAERQLSAHRNGGELTIGGAAPRVGQRFRNPGLARVLEELGRDGRDVFYRGWIAERIVAELEHEGGVMTMDDLAAHAGEWVDPISVPYGDYRVWECPPNGQGLAALLALNAYRHARGGEGTGGHGRTAPDQALAVHLQVEAMRLGFADAARHVADPAFAPAPLEELLGEEYAAARAALVDRDRAMESAGPGLPPGTVGPDTV
ncbi:MAG: gamma-glutamyltransferase, partial [bacterium]